MRLIANGGRMHLLCGAQLSKEDVDAIRRGAELRGVVEQAMVGSLADPEDLSLRARLEALAWMVAQNRLDIRVVLPRDRDGLPLPATEAREYYHPKEGLFEDSAGNKLAFSGSSNDSVNGWQWNYEVFSVYATWPLTHGPDAVPALTPYVTGVEGRFERLWSGREESWIALEIPEAARRKLLAYCPAEAPAVDPLERRPKPASPVARPAPVPDRATVDRERLVFRFLREAPFLPNAHRIGLATSTVSPWPHQVRVVEQVIERFPQSFLFCDEVGLGKTIEAGLVLRQLVISGRVRRALLLVPKSVLRQWQEELYEKFVLNVPRYDGGTVLDVFDREVAWTGPSVWSGVPLLLASSQLAKRRERQGDVLAGEPWDLVIVDEAHHARRRDFQADRYRPNRLLELLAGSGGRPGLRDRTKCLYLLTATPMQLHPVEVWDLLKVVGLGSRWGALEENFLEYFRQLRRPFGDRNWEFILAMVRDFLEAGGTLDPVFAETAERQLGFVEWEMLKSLPHSGRVRSTVAQLSETGRAYLHELAQRHTPLRTMMWRNTRSLLRKYRERGLLKENVPRREPRNEWIPLREGAGGERDLYDRIEAYISDFYQKYEAERKGLGFVMTVYRRRLTSSFSALEKSLERRRAFLLGQTRTADILTDDDVEQDDLDLDVAEELTDEDRARFRGELEYVEDFLHDLRVLGSDSKLERLMTDLAQLFRSRDTVIVFTQYTDTMDNVREQLRGVYGSQVACYSGRGGERWDGAAWVPVPKEALKEAFRKGDEVKILLCTEAASEGLNLQTCGVLINYDMPWNPMRVEQRIGRIDRIGQRFDEVWVRNYFYADTVEAIVYQRLGDRIGWFEDVVGELQPILHRVAGAIERAAMMKPAERARRLDEMIAAIRAEIDTKSTESLDLDTYLDEQLSAAQEAPAPVTLQEMERVIVGSQSLGRLFKPHPKLLSAHVLSWRGDAVSVTFNPEVFDRHPNSVQLLSYGNPLLDELLASAGDPPGSDDPEGIGLFRATGAAPLSFFVQPGSGGARAVLTLAELRGAMSEDIEAWEGSKVEAALSLFAAAQGEAARRQQRVEGDRRKGERLALLEEARQVLVRTALLELAEAQKPDLFAAPLPYGFGSEPVLALKRHGAPYKGLLSITASEGLSADPTDPYFLALQGQPVESLRRRREALRQEGMDVLGRYAESQATLSRSVPAEVTPGAIQRSWLRVAVASPGREPAKVVLLPTRRPPAIQILARQEVRPFENCVPLYGLKVAASRFSGEQQVEEVPSGRPFDPGEYEWVELTGRTRPARDLFVAQVVGESMNRRVPNGAYCLFRARPQGTRQGRVVLAGHREISDRELGGHYTLKVYQSEKQSLPDGTWRHRRIILKPDSTEPGFEPITLENVPEGEFTIIAELIEVLR